MRTLEPLQTSPHILEHLQDIRRSPIILSWRKESRDRSEHMIYNVYADVYAIDMKIGLLRKKLPCVLPRKV